MIAAAGDIACDPTSASFAGGNGTTTSCHAMKTSNMLVSGGFAAILPLGDNQYNCGGYGAFLQSYDPSWGRVKAITHPAVGNHEYLTSGGTDCDPGGKAAGYFQYFGPAAGNAAQGYYSFDVGSWHLIALNSNCGSAGGCSARSPQGKWLTADLAGHSKMCTLAYWHIPLYSSGGRAEANSQYFWQALYAAHADVVLNGHDHTYERFAPQDPSGHLDTASGIREFVVGTGGANHTSFTTVAANSEVRNSTAFGIQEITLHPRSYEWSFVPEPGGTFTDSGTNSCHSASSDTSAPTAPTNLAATSIQAGEIDLGWTASTDNVGVAGYRIYRNGAQVGVSATAAYVDTGVQPATGYSYYTIAYDAAGNSSPASNTFSVTTPAASDTSPPSAPSGVVATAPNPAEVDLSWTASVDNVGVAGYRIYRNGAPVGSSATATYVDTAVQPATRYSYYVAAYDIAGNTSAASNTATVTTPPLSAGTPDIFADGFESGTFSAWTASTNLVIEMATVHSGSNAVEGKVTNSATYTHKTLPSTYGTIYIRAWFRIQSSTTNVSLLSPRTASNSSILHLYVDFSTGKLGLRNDVTLTNRTLASPVSANTWHWVEIKVVVSPTGGVTQVWLDGVDQASLDSTADNLGSANVGDVLIGDSSSSRTFDAFWDDVAVSDAWISG